MTQADSDRRSFLRTATVAGAAMAATGGAAVASDGAKHERQVTPARPGAPFSRAVGYGGIVHVAGVVGRKPGEQNVPRGGFEAECRQALDNLKASVEASGSSMEKVMKCTCFLTNVADFPAFNKVYRTYFPSNPPARSTVVVKALVVLGASLEIDCVTCL